MITEEEWFGMKHRYRNGVSISQIAREEVLDRKTVRKHVRRSTPPESTRKKRSSKLDGYREHIRKRLEDFDLSAVKLFQEIKDQGFEGGYTIVKEYVRSLKPLKGVPAEYRYETKPGHQSQVDWFDFGPVIVDGMRKKLWCFSVILGFSRARFIRFVTDAKTFTFIMCHLLAFEYFGGWTKEFLYDNTKNVVLKRALKSSDSTWNSLFEDFFRYHGFIPRLCKPGKEGAKTKGKIERTGQYIRGNFFAGLEFGSLDELNSLGLNWCDRVNSQVHGTTYEVPFERLKLEVLSSYGGLAPYQVTLTEYRKVSRDCFLSYLGNKYSVPWKYAGRNVKLLIKESRMDVVVDGDVVCSHEIVEGSHRCVRVKEHFTGLYKEILHRNRTRHMRRISSSQVRSSKSVRVMGQYSDVEVQERDLKMYDELSGEEGGK
jgi:transposase